jgi:uncharacterized protein (DUF1697 family)
VVKQGQSYIGLIRGINVGGKNIIRMTDLKLCFENAGLTDVTTYIQSGNVLFRSAKKDKTILEKSIEKSLAKHFGVDLRLILLTPEQIRKVVEEAPHGFGIEPEKYRYDVLFLKDPLTPEEAMRDLRIKDGVDNAFTGAGVLYFSRLISKASQSYLTKLIQMPVYQQLTIRNWNTATKLLALSGNV